MPTVASAPLRLSVAGGGTDLPEHYTEHGCRLLAVALDLTVTVTVREVPSGVHRTAFGATLGASGADELDDPLVRAALLSFGVTEGVAVEVESDVLPGSGLGGSGAFLVALVRALAAHTGRDMAKEEVARHAFHLEREVCGLPVGQQDHWAAARGGAFELRIDTGGRATAEPLPELARAVDALLGTRLLLLRTPITRAADAPLSRQAHRLRSCRGTGMRPIQDLVDAFYDALVAGDVHTVGALLHQHWKTKRELNGAVTNPRIDRWHETLAASGAIGAKVVGAGGGGHLLVATEAEDADRVRAALAPEGVREVAVRTRQEGVWAW